jgi:tetratricopeptide (TPR) repeat protein
MLPLSNKKVFLMLCIQCISHLIMGQEKPRLNEKMWLKADKVFDFGDYLGALKMYEVLNGIDSTNKEINYKMGVCNFEIKPLRKNAMKYFIKASSGTNPEVQYYLGRLYHLSGKFNNAIECYSNYKKSKGEKEHTAKEIDDLIDKSHTAELFELKPDPKVKLENLGPQINTLYPEYVPLIPADEDFMIFTSRRKNTVHPQVNEFGEYYEDIYISKRTAGVWQAPEMMDTTINSPGHDACTGLSADGEKLLLFRTSPDKLSGDIYESLYINGKWSRANKLGPNVNSSEYLEASACYSPEGEVVFFSSNRPGGFGGKDLYSVKRLPNGEWGKPFNLGPKINTEYNEDAPFMHPSGNILFFSSEGHKNMGGYDIFKSTFDEFGNFSEPVNLGFPINKVDDDIFFVLNTNASAGYLSSDRTGGYGSQDIYKVNFLDSVLPYKVQHLVVYDEQNNILKKSEVSLTDSTSGKVIGIFRSNENTGKVLIVSEPFKEYVLSIKVSGYEPLTVTSTFNAIHPKPILMRNLKEVDKADK